MGLRALRVITRGSTRAEPEGDIVNYRGEQPVMPEEPWVNLFIAQVRHV